MMRPGRGLTLLLLSAVTVRSAPAQTGRALAHYDLHESAAWRDELPPDLAEVSGLAFTPDGRLLAHGDERGVVWRYDLEKRRTAGRFGLGDHGGVLRGDFEDIAVVGERLFLVTGTGAIYEGRIAPDGEIGRAARRIRGLAGGCEVEGMTWDPATESLLLLCKTARSERWKDHVVILAVSPETWRFERRPRILVPEDRLERVTGEKRFNGSGLTRHPRTGTYLLVAGPQRGLRRGQRDRRGARQRPARQASPRAAGRYRGRAGPHPAHQRRGHPKRGHHHRLCLPSVAPRMNCARRSPSRRSELVTGTLSIP